MPNLLSLDDDERILDQQKLLLNQQLDAIVLKEQELNEKRKVTDEPTYNTIRSLITTAACLASKNQSSSSWLNCRNHCPNGTDSGLLLITRR